jgi:hypothetical protein
LEVYLKNEKNICKKRRKKKNMYKAIIIVGLVIGASLSGWMLLSNPIMIENVIDDFVESETDYETSWHTIKVFDLTALGEANPGSDASGFLAIFGLNYTGETPGTVLQGNGTDWENAANVSWYADADGFSEDCPADVGWYFVVRVRWNKTHCYDEGDSQFVGTRTRVNITTSGDETIAGTSGTLVESHNDSGGDYLYANYYWDDSDNGYRVTTDGSITVSEIKLEAKY